jgi:hypothetical protein
VENYFNYFTEIEEHFQKRRGTGLLLSTLDWALIETWKDAGIPLEAVLRGIDAAFDRYEQRPSKTRKVNSLAYCSQEVLAAAEDMKEAAVGAAPENQFADEQAASSTPLGFEPAAIADFLRRNAAALENARLPQAAGVSAQPVASEAAQTLRQLALGLEQKDHPNTDVGVGVPSTSSGRAPARPERPGGERKKPPFRLEDLERRLTVLEEKLFAVLLAATSDEEIVNIRAEADRDLAPYRSKMLSAQIDQLHRQYVHKRLLQRHGVPRLSLFYM